MKDLSNSFVERKNILNNNVALKELYHTLDFRGVLFEQKYRYTKQQVADYFNVDVRTINRLLDNNRDELEKSGQEIFTGVRLKQFKEVVTQLKDIHVTQLGEEEEIDLVGARAASLNVGISVIVDSGFRSKLYTRRLVRL